jgi:hypothetical protein
MKPESPDSKVPGLISRPLKAARLCTAKLRNNPNKLENRYVFCG